ncbi:MAG: protein-disulfide reductase DsbD domain-containing protein [Candidatus Sumerlaeaceae bacterium]
MRNFFHFAFCAATILACSDAPAQDSNASIVGASLIANITAVQPETTFTLGVLFKVQPGWHIYWENPGTSGLATKVTWAVPEGGSVGETQYPAPIAFTAPGDIVSYGYEGEVLLMTEARVSAQAKGEVELNAKCRWLMCSDRCIPGKQDVSLRLPIGKGQPANEEVFAKYKALVPKLATAVPKGVEVKRNASGNKTSVEILVAATADAQLVAKDRHPDLHRLFFFPGNQDGVVIDTPQLSAAEASATGAPTYQKPASIRFTMEPSASNAPAPTRVSGVLVRQVVGSGGKAAAPEFVELDLAQ